MKALEQYLRSGLDLSVLGLNRGSKEGGYPKYFKAMTYTVEPDIDRNQIAVLDCADGDSPRPKMGISRGKGNASASSIGIIGRADGPTAVIMGNIVPRTLHAACSAVRFESTDSVEWRIIFREKLKDDLYIKLI